MRCPMRKKQEGSYPFRRATTPNLLAYGATQQGIASLIVMPAGASRTKIAATEGYGGKVHLAEGDLQEATDAVQREGGQTMVHSFDDLKIIAGAGTVGLEILEDEPEVDVVVAGIGGGGLISGVAAAMKTEKPSVRVVGVEPEGADGMSRSLKSGRPETLDKRDTVADGLAAPFAGEYTLAHVQQFCGRGGQGFGQGDLGRNGGVDGEVQVGGRACGSGVRGGPLVREGVGPTREHCGVHHQRGQRRSE